MAALTTYDFATVFRRIRAATGWSQQTLGNLIGLDQGRVSAIERNARRLRDIAVIARVATFLCIPPILLGFGDLGTTVGEAWIDGPKVVDWVERRNFVEHVGALTVGVTAVAGLDIDRLIALLPQDDPTSTRHIGAADVEAIEQATAAFKSQDFAQGSGLGRSAAVAQLRATLPLLRAKVTTEVRPRLLVATAHLATLAGWMSYDSNRHDAARRLWMIGLGVVREADHPQGTDLSVYLLNDLAIQAVHLRRPDEALQLAHLGHAVAARTHPVSASTTSCLASIQARAHAAQGDTVGCDRALGQAIERFSAIDPMNRPPWGAHQNEAVLAAKQGVAHYTLALAERDPCAAERAVPLLRHAVDHVGPDYDRLRAQYLADLAGAHALSGDIDTAVGVGHQAVDAVAVLHSPQSYDRLRVLDTALEPLHTSTGVAELRDRLATTAV
ncbi:MAG: helix-turn-helix domain-containing protein [Pseudonocardiaceae bacterium]